MATSISALQLTQAKSWSGMTKENHLGYLMGRDRILFTEFVDEIMAINYADEYKKFLGQFPERTLDQDSEYEWFLKGINLRNYPLIAVYTDLAAAQAGTTATGNLGFGFSTFVLEFDVRMFENTDKIVSNKPEIFQFQVVQEPVANGSNWLYVVRLWGSDPTLTIPAATELAAGARFTKLYSPTEQTLSVKGGNVSHDGYFKMYNRMSNMRKMYEAPGNMIDMKINQAQRVKFKDQNGNLHDYWMDMLTIDYLKEWDTEKAFQLMYSRWNKTANGTYQHDGISGNPIMEGSGFYEQISPSNVYQNTLWDLDYVTAVLMSLSYNKIKQSDRKFKIWGGEGAFIRMHSFLDQTALVFSNNNAGDRVSGANNDLMVSGQFKRYGWLNGIQFELDVMPFFDDPRIPSQLYPNSNLPARSYELLIMEMGNAKDGKPNIEIVRPKNQLSREVHRYIAGLRTPYDTPGYSAADPTAATSSKDGWEMHSQATAGIQINNPTKIARIIPYQI